MPDYEHREQNLPLADQNAVTSQEHLLSTHCRADYPPTTWSSRQPIQAIGAPISSMSLTYFSQFSIVAP